MAIRWSSNIRKYPLLSAWGTFDIRQKQKKFDHPGTPYCPKSQTRRRYEPMKEKVFTASLELSL